MSDMSAKPAPQAVRTTKGATSGKAAPPSASLPPARSAAPLLKDLPATPPPTVAEWKSATAVQVKGADLLGCVTESVREWIRVSCRKPSIGGGRPTRVTVLGVQSKDVLAFAKGGVTSVQFRFGRGFELEALFTFGVLHHIMPLRVRWPEDVLRRPSRIGAFVGVPKVTAAEHQQACDCLDQYMKPACSPGYFAPECLRRVEDSMDCTPLLDCQNRAPAGLATCAEGEIYDGVCSTCRCVRTCKKDSECPKDHACMPSFQDESRTVCSTK